MSDRKPDAVAFACPTCGAEWLAETAGGAATWSPPVCRFGHEPTEMEQRYLGADAFKGGDE